MFSHDCGSVVHDKIFGDVISFQTRTQIVTVIWDRGIFIGIMSCGHPWFWYVLLHPWFFYGVLLVANSG